MGNKPPSSPCFDEEIYATLSWADARGTCQNVCNNAVNQKPLNGSPTRKLVPKASSPPPTLPKADQREDYSSTSLSGTSTALRSDPLPALTDNLSSSEPSSADEANPSRSHIRDRCNGTDGRQVEVIELHHQTFNLSPSHSAEYYLGLAASSNDYTTGTSGSLERDARVDLGTSRGSSGGREDVDELESRMDISELSQRRPREE